MSQSNKREKESSQKAEEGSRSSLIRSTSQKIRGISQPNTEREVPTAKENSIKEKSSAEIKKFMEAKSSAEEIKFLDEESSAEKTKFMDKMNPVQAHNSMEKESSEEEKKFMEERVSEEQHLARTITVIQNNLENYGEQVSKMKADIDEMLEHYHDDNPELNLLLNNTITLHDHMKRALERNERALSKPYFGRIVFWDEAAKAEESLYIGKGGISSDATHQVVVDWRAPVANAYYENGLGRCSYTAPGGKEIEIDLRMKRTYEIEGGRLLDYFDSEVIANDELLTKYLAKNKQAVLGEIVATIQKEQNEIIRKSPYHNIIVQGVAGSGKTTVAMHRISFILYNYAERFKPDDFYIVGSNRILLNYITSVLPDLDVHGVRQMTLEQLFVRLLYEDWDEKKYRIRKSTTGNRGSVKGSLGWFEDLKAYCDELEWKGILRESLYLNPKQFVEGCRNGRIGVYDETGSPPDSAIGILEQGADSRGLILLVDGAAVERYIRQNPKVSMQNKINMLNERLLGKVKEEFLGKGIKYTESERKAILRAYRGRYGGKVWKGSIYKLYQEFLEKQAERGMKVDIPDREFDVYDLAALAYLYKRIKETEVISEAHHIVIDEAQDFGMMAYSVLHFCIQACTYTVMGDVSQNIHFGFGLNDWEELKALLLPDPMDNFGVLKKSYRNTVEISNFAANILNHGQFTGYPAEPIIRHGESVEVRQSADDRLYQDAAKVCREWQEKGFDTIAVICRNQESSDLAARELGKYVEVRESDLEKAVFGNGIIALPVEYTKGLEFDAVLILDPDRTEYPVDNGHAKLLYVAATRALHELCVLHRGNLTGLIADPLPTEEPKDETAQNPEKIHGENNKADTPQIRPQDLSKGRTAAGSISKTTNEPRTASDRTSRNTDEPRTASDKTSRGTTAQQAAVTRQRPSAYLPKTQTVSASPGGQLARYYTSFRNEQTEKRIPAPSKNRILPKSDLPNFGDIPPKEKLRPAGHSRPDLAIRWISRQSDGLYLQSRYGILRITPVGSAIMRVSFVKNGQPDSSAPYGIAVNRTEKYWMYKESQNVVELTTDELLLQVDKSTGAIRYLTRDKKILLAERSRECRLLDTMTGGGLRAWLFLDWPGKEQLYGIGPDEPNAGSSSACANILLRGTARYLSHGGGNMGLPFLLSDKGYGLLLPTQNPVFSCDIPAYGSYLCAENVKQMDYYFIFGKRQETILNACAYLCGV